MCLVQLPMTAVSSVYSIPPTQLVNIFWLFILIKENLSNCKYKKKSDDIRSIHRRRRQTRRCKENGTRIVDGVQLKIPKKFQVLSMKMFVFFNQYLTNDPILLIKHIVIVAINHKAIPSTLKK